MAPDSVDSVAFDRAAGYYDETRGFPPGHASRVGAVIAQAGGLGADSRVLEIGIGTGRIALPLASHVGAVYGVDLARPMLARLAAKRRDEPVMPVEGNMLALPYPAQAFDAVVAVHVFHLVRRWRDVLDEVARVLRPGGLLLSGNRRSAHNTDPLETVLWDVWDAYSRELAPMVGLDFGQSAESLAEAGWVPVGEPLTHEYRTSLTPREFIRRIEQRIWSRLWQMTDEQIAQGAALVRAKVDELGIALDSPMTIPARFEVQAFRPPSA